MPGMRKTVYLLSAFLLLASLFAASAKMVSYKLELRITTDRYEEYPFEIGIDDREYRRITENVHTGIQPFLLEARKAIADRAGYRVEIYGADNYKMVVVRSYVVIIRDLSQGRVVFSKE